MLVSMLLAGCFDTDKGPAPPPNSFYYPTGLTASPAGHALYVANSDFDLQYSAGTIQALDLDRLRAKVSKLLVDASGETAVDEMGRALLDGSGQPRKVLKVNCARVEGLEPNSKRPNDAILYPGPCTPIDLEPAGEPSFIRNVVEIGAFATNIRFLRQPPALGSSGADSARPARLMLPVRGDPSLTWIDVDDDTGGAAQSFKLDCGQGGSKRCSDAHRSGIDPATNTRDLTLPPEPFDLAVSDRGDVMVMTHQTSGAVSLLQNGWSGDEKPTPTACSTGVTQPTLQFVYSGLPTQVSGVVALPTPRRVLLGNSDDGTARAYAPGFLVGYRDAARLDVLRYIDDCKSQPRRPYLAASGGGTGIALTAGGIDSRSIAVDASEMRACEASCGDADLACLDVCVGVPMGLYVASRTPSSLLGGTLQDESASLSELIPLPQGASRVEVGQVTDRQGKRQTRVFVLSFDEKQVTVYNPATQTVEKQMPTGRGPSALTFDTAEGASFGYLAYFTDSYLSVIDLDMRHSTYLTLIANVGRPQAPRESQ